MKLSVLLPARNAASTVGRALRSVCKSRGLVLGRDFEIVVVAHESTDDTRARIAAFGDRVRVVDAPAAWSLPRVLEEGRRACTAPVVARMDADDLMHPDRLQRDLAWLDARPDVDVVACRTKVLRRDRGHALSSYVAWQNGVSTAEEHAREMWIEQPLCHPAATFRARVVDEVGGYRDGPFAEDYDLFLRLVLRGARIEKRPEVHHGWREHPHMSTRKDPRYHRDGFAQLKAQGLVQRFHVDERPLFIAGAGKEGGRIGRALVAAGALPTAYFDVADRRIGRVRHGAPTLDVARMRDEKQAQPSAFCVAAVGTSGSRSVVRGALFDAGFREGHDAVVVA
jgi:hypothetical protein